MKHSAPINAILKRQREANAKRENTYSLQHTVQIAQIAKAVESLENLSINKSPIDTDAAHTLKLAKATENLKLKAQKMREDAHETYRSGLMDIESAIKKQAGLIADSNASEIRQALRMMKPEERHEALNNALKNGEGVIIAAIVDAPTLLTGIDPKLASRYQESLERMKAPDLVADRDSLNDSFTTALTVLKSVDNAINAGFDREKLQEISASEKRHQEAAMGFENAIAGENT